MNSWGQEDWQEYEKDYPECQWIREDESMSDTIPVTVDRMPDVYDSYEDEEDWQGWLDSLNLEIDEETG